MKTINRVYLAGGMHNDWRKQVIESCHEFSFEFYNPQNHGLISPDDYSTWDIHFIKQCDILFTYMDKENPSGYGLMLEIGYAKALNKTIIFVWQELGERDKYFEIAGHLADVRFLNLDMGIKFLKTLEF